MHELRILKVVFDTTIEAWEIPAFRGAVNEMLGRRVMMFHNHIGKDDFNYSYPLIQYKRQGGKPMILCLGEGVDEMHHYFNKRVVMLSIGGKLHEMKIHSLNLSTFIIDITQSLTRYSIKNWIALNQSNHPKYKNFTSDADRVAKLEQILISNILSMAKGIDYRITDQIKLQIIGKPTEGDKKKIKIVKFDSFDLEFAVNMILPSHIGLGKRTSIGYGTIHPVKSLYW